MKEKFLKEEKWAVVGVSPNEEKFGHKIYKKMLDCGYTVYPVNKNYDYVENNRVYPDLSSLPEDVSVVNLVVRPDIGIEILKEMKSLNIKKVWLQPGAESDEIMKYAMENDIEIVESCILIAMCSNSPDSCCVE